MKDLLVMALCGTVDSGISMYFRGLKRIAKKIERMRGQQNPKVHLLQQFSLYWVSHTEPLKDGILLSYEEFSRAVRRFSKFYNEHTLEEQLKNFYAIAVSVWKRFQTPPTNEEIKHALLEIAAKMLDKDFQRSHQFEDHESMGLGECLFSIAKQFYQEKRTLNEKSFINQFFSAFEGILIKGEEKYVQLCKDYHRFLKDVINVHFSSKLQQSPHSHERGLLKYAAIYCMEMYIKTASYPLYPLEDFINFFLSESTQKIVAHNFRPQRIAVSENTIQKLQLQIQIIGIKGFLVWKRVFAGIQIYKGLSVRERINMIGVVGLIKELVLFAPIINFNTVQIKQTKDEFVLKVAKHLRLSQAKIKLYHGIAKQQWIVFKIKSIEQAKFILAELTTRMQELNTTVNTLYQEALRTIRNKRETLLLSKQIGSTPVVNDSESSLTPINSKTNSNQPFCHPEREDLPTIIDSDQEDKSIHQQETEEKKLEDDHHGDDDIHTDANEDEQEVKDKECNIREEQEVRSL